MQHCAATNFPWIKSSLRIRMPKVMTSLWINSELKCYSVITYSAYFVYFMPFSKRPGCKACKLMFAHHCPLIRNCYALQNIQHFDGIKERKWNDCSQRLTMRSNDIIKVPSKGFLLQMHSEWRWKEWKQAISMQKLWKRRLNHIYQLHRIENGSANFNSSTLLFGYGRKSSIY